MRIDIVPTEALTRLPAQRSAQNEISSGPTSCVSLLLLALKRREHRSPRSSAMRNRPHDDWYPTTYIRPYSQPGTAGGRHEWRQPIPTCCHPQPNQPQEEVHGSHCTSPEARAATAAGCSADTTRVNAAIPGRSIPSRETGELREQRRQLPPGDKVAYHYPQELQT